MVPSENEEEENRLTMENRKLKNRVADLEAEQLGQQVADSKVKYAQEQVVRAEKNDLISRQGWQQAMELIQMAVAELEKPNFSRAAALAILKTKIETGPKPIYTAIFLDDVSVAALLKRYPPKHSTVHAHHVTLVFKPSPKDLQALEPHVGSEVLFDVVGEAQDERGQVAKVTVPLFLRIDGQEHHVTLSTAEGVTPVYSNELLKKGWTVKEPFLQLKGIVRHFTK